MANHSTAGSPAALVRALVDHLPTGVIVLDAGGRVVCVNAYERRVAGRHAADAVGGRSFSEVAPCFEVRGLAGAFRAGILKDSVDIETEVSFRFEHLPAPRDVRLSIRSFALGSELFAAVCLQDISEFREHERRRDLIAATTVHDLKTPLAVAAMEIGAALKRVGGDGVARELLESARAGIDRASRLAATLLDVRRIARGEVSAARVELDLVPLAEATLETMRPLADAQAVSLALAGDRAAPVQCEPRLVPRALENLIDNAIRNAPEGSTVTTVVERTARGARLSVVDHGRGVPPERRDAIFDAATGGAAGWNFGLGLALVSLVAERHGGRAWVEDTPGAGATFVLELEG